MIRRVCFFVCLVCGWCCAAFSQNIQGKVVDVHSDVPLSFANVAILQPQDSSVVTGTVTDDNGLFSVTVPEGDWLVRISLIGYESYTAALRQADLGTIRLQPAREVLSEVVVTGHAKMFNLEDGGISADVQNTPLKDMGSLSDVLGQMPFVSKSGTSFTVLGKGSPIFYINNRLVRDNNDLLRIQSNEVKKVTVITNPGAEYDASVNAVIKIETYRPVGEGFSVDLWTYNRYNSEWYTMDRASFNYRNKNLDIFADMNYANMAFPKDRVWNTEIETDEGIRSVISRRSDMDKVKFYTPKVGFNYIVNDKHSFGVQYEYSNSYDNPHDYDIDTESALEGVADEPIHTRTLGNSDSYSHYVNAYYNGQLADWLNAKLDMDYKTSESDGYEGAINTLTDQSRENLRTLSNGNYDLYAAKLTLQTPLLGGNLTYGGEGSYTKNEQATDVAENDGIPGVNSSTNEVEQDLYAAFVSYNRSFGAFSGDIGLRYENVNSEYYENGQLVEEQSRRHKRLFPTFRLSYQCTDDLQMELAYRNTVSRPAYSSLRSYIVYMGPYQYGTGNPLLQPTYTNSLSYMLKWKQFMLMGIYRKVTDYTAEISELYMGNSILNRMVNIDDAQFLTVALNYSSAFGIWRPNYDISVDKNYISFGDPEITYNKPVFRFNFRNGFSINGWNFGVDVSGRTKGNDSYLYYNTKFSWGTDIYVNTSFFNDRLLVGLQGIDIFDTRNDDFSVNYNYLNTYWENSMFRRTLMFSVTYRFNMTPKRYKGSNASDEIWRL